MHRLFVAIRPPEDIRDLLVDAMDQGADFRWQDDAQLHITLRVIGEVGRPTANDLADALRRIHAPPLKLHIAGVGRFEQRNSGALWAAIEPKQPVSALAAKIERVCQSLGLEAERRSFHPHITLARWKGRRRREVQAFLERTHGLSSDAFMICEFILFESRLSRHGAHYEEITRYKLAS